MKRKLALVLALLMVFAMFAGCSKQKTADTKAPDNSQTVTAKPDSGSTIGTTTTTPAENVTEETVHPSDDARLKAAWNIDCVGLMQVGYAFGQGLNHAHLFAETLLNYNSSTGEIEPFIATEWEWRDDLTLRLKLRDDVTSIIGDPMTANDVIYTWKVGCDTAANSSYFSALFDIEKCKAVDDYTVDLVLLNPYPMLVQDLAHYAYAIAVEESVKKLGGLEACKDNPGAQTGPYKLVKWEQGVCIYAERREDYWGIMPYYKYVDQYIVTDNNTRSMGVESGDYDVGAAIALTTINAQKESKGVNTWAVASMGNYTAMVINSDVEPLNVKEVRQAISLALDCDAILQVACQGLGTTTDSIYNPAMSVYSPAGTGNKDVENCKRFDLEAAKQKMIDAGYPDGFTLTCKYKNSTNVTPSVEVVQNMLREINITVEPKMLESATLSSDLRAGDFEIQISSGGNPNPKRLATMYDPRSTHNAATGCCGAVWAPEGTEELIDKCLTTLDDTERFNYYAQLQDIIREYCPMITLFCPYTGIMTNPEINHVGLDIMSSIKIVEFYPDAYING